MECRSGGQILKNTAPSQHPKPKKTARRSRTWLVNRYGNPRLKRTKRGETRMARWAPKNKPERERERVVMVTERRAMNE